VNNGRTLAGAAERFRPRQQAKESSNKSRRERYAGPRADGVKTGRLRKAGNSYKKGGVGKRHLRDAVGRLKVAAKNTR